MQASPCAQICIIYAEREHQEDSEKRYGRILLSVL